MYRRLYNLYLRSGKRGSSASATPGRSDGCAHRWVTEGRTPTSRNGNQSATDATKDVGWLPLNLSSLGRLHGPFIVQWFVVSQRRPQELARHRSIRRMEIWPAPRPPPPPQFHYYFHLHPPVSHRDESAEAGVSRPFPAFESLAFVFLELSRRD